MRYEKIFMYQFIDFIKFFNGFIFNQMNDVIEILKKILKF